MKKWIPLLAALAVAAPLHAEPVTPPAAQASAMSEGVVRKIDAANARITLRHGPIANLDMPPMTMVFRVQSPELLSGIKVGDTVKFRAEDVNGSFTVTAIQAAP
ncbi:MAG: copper-binding protein [Thiobacillus sp.]|nr:copper-binding protein [Thiobacillus sp.]MDP2978668.1 copper-binding protein [Thiobacillus sp.]